MIHWWYILPLQMICIMSFLICWCSCRRCRCRRYRNRGRYQQQRLLIHRHVTSYTSHRTFSPHRAPFSTNTHSPSLSSSLPRWFLFDRDSCLVDGCLLRLKWNEMKWNVPCNQTGSAAAVAMAGWNLIHIMVYSLVCTEQFYHKNSKKQVFNLIIAVVVQDCGDCSRQEHIQEPLTKEEWKIRK